MEEGKKERKTERRTKKKKHRSPPEEKITQNLSLLTRVCFKWFELRSTHKVQILLWFEFRTYHRKKKAYNRTLSSFSVRQILN